jgi:hypothetical protein
VREWLPKRKLERTGINMGETLKYYFPIWSKTHIPRLTLHMVYSDEYGFDVPEFQPQGREEVQQSQVTEVFQQPSSPPRFSSLEPEQEPDPIVSLRPSPFPSRCSSPSPSRCPSPDLPRSRRPTAASVQEAGTIPPPAVSRRPSPAPSWRSSGSSLSPPPSSPPASLRARRARKVSCPHHLDLS